MKGVKKRGVRNTREIRREWWCNTEILSISIRRENGMAHVRFAGIAGCEYGSSSGARSVFFAKLRAVWNTPCSDLPASDTIQLIPIYVIQSSLLLSVWSKHRHG